MLLDKNEASENDESQSSKKWIQSEETKEITLTEDKIWDHKIMKQRMYINSFAFSLNTLSTYTLKTSHLLTILTKVYNS